MAIHFIVPAVMLHGQPVTQDWTTGFSMKGNHFTYETAGP